MELAITSMFVGDIDNIFIDDILGNKIKTMILENAVLDQGKKTREQIEQLRESEDDYNKLLEKITLTIEDDIKPTLEEYLDYIDMDKFLLTSAYRYIEALENGEEEECKEVSGKNIDVRSILMAMLGSIKNSEAKTVCLRVEMDDSKTYKIGEPIEFSVKDLKRSLKQFTSKGYIKKAEIQEYGRKIREGEINLSQLDQEYVDIIFSNNELEELSLLSPENFIYIYRRNNWDTNKVMENIKRIGLCSTATLHGLISDEKIGSQELIELYESNIISLNTIKELEGTVDLSARLNFEIINRYYIEAKENPEDEQLLNRYKRYVELYKEVFMNDKSEDEIEENSSSSMEKLIESFEGKEYNEAIKEYYRNGLITLDSIVDWNDEELITELYVEKIISLQELDNLARRGKLSVSYISARYEEVIWDNNLSQEQRVDILSKGWISIETIEKLFRKNLIDREDLRRLVEGNIISEEKKKEITESLSLEKAEENSPIILSIGDEIRKITGKEREVGTRKYNPGTSATKDKIIISPNIRDEFFRLLGAETATVDEINEDNPFYNYHFYVIVGKDGKKHLNSPVIAERYYEDKETERNFATENATYFFQYGDLMVLSNYAKKDEVVGKKENVVFRSNHTIANEKRKGNWASSVIGNVIRTILSSDLKDYNKEEQTLKILEEIQKMYSREEIMAILSLEEEIDSGKHLYEVVKEKSVPNFDDNDDGERE